MTTIDEKLLHHQVNVEIQTEFLDRIYTRTRQRIRERQGMITHEDAMKLVLKEYLRKIHEDYVNDIIDDFSKTDPVLAENLRSKDPKVSESALRVLLM